MNHFVLPQQLDKTLLYHLTAGSRDSLPLFAHLANAQALGISNTVEALVIIRTVCIGKRLARLPFLFVNQLHNIFIRKFGVGWSATAAF